MTLRPAAMALTVASMLVVASCGGGSGGNAPFGPAGPTQAQRAAAAAATAGTNALCSASALGSYYWEIGDGSGALASGSIGTGVDADTVMNIASASKWLFAAYVLQTNADITPSIAFLNFTSGYSNFDNAQCPATGTIAQCMNGGRNAAEAAAATFHYQGGHLQQLAIDLGLGPLRNATLANEVRAAIGNDVQLSYVEPLPPGGVRTSARSYAVFLRKLLVGSGAPLRMASALGTHAVCTQPSATCNASTETAAAIPEEVHYSLGHWVEDDPAATPASNFAYSSAGKFGFYPWVDFSRTLYGVVARYDQTLTTGEGYSSLRCGRLIRLAWKTGIAQ